MKAPIKGPDQITILYSNLGHLLVHFFMVLYPTAVLGMGAEFGLGYGELIALSMPGFFLFGLGAIPAGWLGDRWSGLGMIGVMFLGLGGAALFTSMANSPLMLSLGIALIGLFASIYHPVGIAIIVRHAEKRGRTIGINGVFGGAGLASGPFVAGLLTDLYGWRSAFLAPGIVVLVLAVAYALQVRLSGLKDRTTDLKPEPDVRGGRVVSVFMVLMMMTLCSGLIFQMTTLAMPKVFAQRMNLYEGFDAASAGGLVSLIYICTSLFQIAGGHMADRFALKHLYLVIYLLQIPMVLLAAVVDNWWLLFAMLGVTLGYSAAAPAESAMFARYSPSKWRGTSFGFKFVMALGVSALGVPLVGYIHETTGEFFWMFMVIAALSLVAALFSMLLPSKMQENESAPTIMESETVAPGAQPAAASGGGD